MATLGWQTNGDDDDEDDDDCQGDPSPHARILQLHLFPHPVGTSFELLGATGQLRNLVMGVVHLITTFTRPLDVLSHNVDSIVNLLLM